MLPDIKEASVKYSIEMNRRIKHFNHDSTKRISKQQIYRFFCRKRNDRYNYDATLGKNKDDFEILPLVRDFPTEQVTCIDSQTWMPYKPDRKSMIKIVQKQ